MSSQVQTSVHTFYPVWKASCSFLNVHFLHKHPCNHQYLQSSVVPHLELLQQLFSTSLTKYLTFTAFLIILLSQ